MGEVKEGQMDSQFQMIFYQALPSGKFLVSFPFMPMENGVIMMICKKVLHVVIYCGKFCLYITCIVLCTMYQVPSLIQTAETDDLFDPLEDSQTLNTFTRRDHLFARLDFILEKAAVTLYHQDKMKSLLKESGVIQLEFSGFYKYI